MKYLVLILFVFKIGYSQNKIIDRFVKEYGGDIRTDKVQIVDNLIFKDNKYKKTIVEMYDMIYLVNGDIVAPEGLSITLRLNRSTIFYTGKCPFTHKNVIKCSNKVQLMSKREFRKFKDDDFFIIYKEGKIVTKGTSKHLKMNTFTPGKYDIRIKGKTFYSNYLLY